MDLDFIKDYILENERTKLIPLRIEDFEKLKIFSLNEPGLWEFSLSLASGLNNLKNYIEDAVKGRQLKHTYAFIVFDKQTNEYAGSTRFYDYNHHHKTTQLGFTWFGKKFQGTGLNQNCKLLMLQFAFEDLKLERVEFRADLNNKRSISAMKKIGCTQEGILRNNCTSPSGRRNSIVLSILKTEWEKNIKENLISQI